MGKRFWDKVEIGKVESRNSRTALRGRCDRGTGRGPGERGIEKAGMRPAGRERRILFANEKKRAQVIFHAQEDANGSVRRGRGPGERLRGAEGRAGWDLPRVARSHARGDSGRYYTL